MPGLIRGVARTAVIAGTATAVSNGVSRRQVGRWQKKADEEQATQEQAQPQQAAAEPAADDMDAKIEQLQKLAKLKDAGILTDEEFASEKAKILG